MRICMILEGSYPYTHGGVSSWAHNLITSMKEHEFVLWVIGADLSKKGNFFYKLPDNVVEVDEVFLSEANKQTGHHGKSLVLTEGQRKALEACAACADPDFGELIRLLQGRKVSPADLLMSRDFLQMLESLCEREYPWAAFSDTFHTVRSMLLPVLYMLAQKVPEADVYHAVCTGYAGLLGITAKELTGKPFFLTEHGIYSREREEEIIRATWVNYVYKRQWIRFFYMLSRSAYRHADVVSSLFGRAMETQIELGAERDHCMVIPNGVDYTKFSQIPLKEDNGIVDIAAVIRIARIKDVKTLLFAFRELLERRQNVRLHILGGVDEEDYAKECHQLAKDLNLGEKAIFAGQVNVVEYMEGVDFTVLSSISEGQPLSVLESLAACRPCVTTDVGCCRALLYGEKDDPLGTCGYVVPPMDKGAMAQAMDRMCESREERIAMGRIGQERVKRWYQKPQMIIRYDEVYQSLVKGERLGGNRI